MQQDVGASHEAEHGDSENDKDFLHGQPSGEVPLEPGAVRWGLDGWQDVREQETAPNPLGLHVLEVDTPRLRAGQRIDLTFRHAATWIGQDFRIQVVPRARPD